MQIKKLKNLIIAMLISVLALSVFVTLVPIISKLKNSNNKNVEVCAWSGAGTPGNPYLIKTKEDMNTLAANVNKGNTYYLEYFELTADLDYAIDDFGNPGDYTPVGVVNGSHFSGVFNGAGHTISNTKISINNVNATGVLDDYCVGIFGQLNSATIRNLKSENMLIEFSGNNYTNDSFMLGGIAGCALYSTIEYCEGVGLRVRTKIPSNPYNVTEEDYTVIDDYVYIGGIAGFAGTIRHCKGEVYSVNLDYVHEDSNFTVASSGIGNTNSNYSVNISYCWGDSAYIVCYHDKVKKKSRSITNQIPYGSTAESDYDLDWIDYTDVRVSTTTVKYCYSGWYEDWHEKKYANLSPSSAWGPTGSTWFYDSDYHDIQPHLRQFMKWYNYTFRVAYKNSQREIILKPDVLLEIKNAPNDYTSVEDRRKPSTTIFGKSLVYSAREGYTFQNWQNADEDESDNEVLWIALLKLTEYTITYEGAEGTTDPTTYNIETDSFTLTNPVKLGYRFLGWTGSNGTTPQRDITISRGSTGNRTYTANWELEQYTIEYDYAGIEPIYNPSTYNITTPTFTLNNPTREGYIFKGWKEGTGTSVIETVTISQGSTGNLKFTAVWEEIPYTINYELKGGSQEHEYKNNYTVSETPIELSYTPIKRGCVFIGWSGNYLTGDENETILIPQGTTGDLTYTANWELEVYTIEYDYGGASPVTNPESYTIETETFTLNNPTREGYTFLGWIEFNDDEIKDPFIIEKGSITGSKMFTAVWEIITFDVKINVIKNYDETTKEEHTIVGDYGNKFIYDANLTLTNNSYFSYAYKNTANTTIESNRYAYEGYFLEYYKIRNIKEEYADNIEVTNQEIIIYSDIIVELMFVNFYEVEFETEKVGVESFEDKNPDNNTVIVRKGSNVLGSTIDNKLIYKLTYFDGKTDCEQEVATYTIKRYYVVLEETDKDEKKDISETTEKKISPVFTYYACDVTMGDITAGFGKQEGETNFTVEYGTKITFKAEIKEGVFVYTYTFMYGEEEIAKVTYTMATDDYAMESELDKETRIWHTAITESNLTEEEITRAKYGVEISIEPQFGFKEYDGELA